MLCQEQSSSPLTHDFVKYKYIYIYVLVSWKFSLLVFLKGARGGGGRGDGTGGAVPLLHAVMPPSTWGFIRETVTHHVSRTWWLFVSAFVFDVFVFRGNSWHSAGIVGKYQWVKGQTDKLICLPDILPHIWVVIVGSRLEKKIQIFILHFPSQT